MENQNQYLHEVAITAIVVKGGKYYGILDELAMADDLRRGKKTEWRRFE
ncbi:MAG: hypothetical protein HYW15_01855 [Candidatus Giovannonibacteria bacterium]|nr:MAG: hypothetical protein HYW15_01855 [Candidatus Giovannonibacteria bacterium]